MSDYEPIKVVDTESPREFLEALSIHSERFHTQPGGWLFRGLSNDAYELVPTVLRADPKTLSNIERIAGRDFEYSKETKIPAHQKIPAYQQVLLEIHLFERFAGLVNESGLELPGGDAQMFLILHKLIAHVEKIRSSAQDEQDNNVGVSDGTLTETHNYTWPFTHAYRLLALARHSGVPTRLLDWSRTPRIAAYFAASEAAAAAVDRYDGLGREREELKEQKISVWAVEELILGSIDGDNSLREEQIRIPYDGNRNMFAQRGTFTMTRSSLSSATLRRDIDRRPVDLRVKDTCRWSPRTQSAGNNLQSFEDHGPVMYRIRLPAQYSGELLWYLSKEGISRNTMFPEYSEIVSALKEEWLQQPSG